MKIRIMFPGVCNDAIGRSLDVWLIIIHYSILLHCMSHSSISIVESEN